MRDASWKFLNSGEEILKIVCGVLMRVLDYVANSVLPVSQSLKTLQVLTIPTLISFSPLSDDLLYFWKCNGFS